ncbi:hypothetical protein G3O08_20315 [Cryomorpha ignava]|uniref:Uncharacterized protein n=1 Tax=Cryomorpha ignava TaxID=101383 RepID=A0A7K3WWA8_9FLAO|nr:hypothetical protein [Cryomorpha ignava]NEN25838.1 hypothetical protein [Cryomorpha ignava]
MAKLSYTGFLRFIRWTGFADELMCGFADVRICGCADVRMENMAGKGMCPAEIAG